MAWLDYFKLFWWFYYAYTKDIVFVWLSTFICANNTAGVVNSLFGVKILIPVPTFASSSWSSSDGMGGRSSSSQNHGK